MRQLALAVFLTLVLREACADSDSYFCTSAGYLAYELREWSAPEKRHVLKVVLVGGADGIAEPRTVPLEDFQLHGMKCEPDRIASPQTERRYQLRIAYKEERQGAGLIRHQTTSTLIERDASGKVLRRRLVHRGTAEETVD